MMVALADKALLEMYGEKLDSSETDDYWPFVCINLTSPSFMHTQKEWCLKHFVQIKML